MNGVKVRFLNREAILPLLEERVQKIFASRSDILEVSLFGSLARGNHAPGSDADIFILLKDDPRRMIDRIPEFLDYFLGIGVPVEVFPYTFEEIEKMKNNGFMKTIQKEKIILASRS